MSSRGVTVAMPVLTHRSMRGAWTGATADDRPATSRVDVSQRVCVDVRQTAPRLGTSRDDIARPQAKNAMTPSPHFPPSTTERARGAPGRCSSTGPRGVPHPGPPSYPTPTPASSRTNRTAEPCHGVVAHPQPPGSARRKGEKAGKATASGARKAGPQNEVKR